MLKFGTSPYLECSSRVDKRFSAFYARIASLGNKTIEELYQAKKVFADGSTGLSVKDAKGRKPVNIEQCRQFYSELWRMFFSEHQGYLAELANSEYQGFCDIFGSADHACQAEEVYNIVMEQRHEMFMEEVDTCMANMEKYRHLICNRRWEDEEDLKDGIYCGRGSEWGNDYSHLPNSSAKFKVKTRDEAVVMHRRQLIKRIESGQVSLHKLASLAGRKLICYCAPSLCHCSTLAAAAVWAKGELV